MFTGLIEDVGTIVKLERKGDGALLVVNHTAVLDDLKLGDSVAVDGVCLTITELNSPSFSAEASAETIRRTTLEAKKPHETVNLERALRLNDRLGGHLVTGHVDEVGTITSIVPEGNSQKITITVSPKTNRYVVEKGSVTVDGISLTVNEVRDDRFSVNIIPYTASQTTLTAKRPGDKVNIEADILGKYLERLAGTKPQGKLDAQFLSEHGFL
jgi:riboflavin synthase